MTQSYVNGSNDVVSMTYRADGLRVTKANAVPGNNANKFTHYRYDGQMGIEDVEVTSGGTYNSITRYALGARGVDSISRTTSGGTSVVYPLYDAHGNNVGLLSKSGSSWSISDERSYDAWGQVRSGGSTGDQKGRYSANLGHKQDDESGLIYMRARYYEPTSGRFISDDRQRDGSNWQIYCKSNPVSYVDETGNSTEDGEIAGAILLRLIGPTLAKLIQSAAVCLTSAAVALSGILFIIAWQFGSDAIYHKGIECYIGGVGAMTGIAALSTLLFAAGDAIGALMVSKGLLGGESPSIAQRAKATVEAYASTIALFVEVEGINHDFRNF